MAITVYDPQVTGTRLPIKSWAGTVEKGVEEQAFNLANHPVAISHIALMPDAHTGYGMPIGGVLFADKAVVPYAIGVDIGCGVLLLDTGLNKAEIEPSTIERFALAAYELIPTGFNVNKTPEYSLEQLSLAMDAEPPESVKPEWLAKALPQVGTLGGGNHFIEFQADEDGRIYVMLHSGSRSLGKNICDFYHKRALEENERYKSTLPDNHLAFLPQGGRYFTEYWTAMNYALKWAELNRLTMLMRVIDAMYDITKADEVNIVVDCHHNYAQWENHFGRNGIVHRKGAVRATTDDIVLIPGSMGTASYIGVGLGNPQSFESCQHGAGRAMSRTAARKLMASEQVYVDMASLGIGLYSSSPADAAEEASFAYKDIESVMERSSDLVMATSRLTPLAVVKG